MSRGMLTMMRGAALAPALILHLMLGLMLVGTVVSGCGSSEGQAGQGKDGQVGLSGSSWTLASCANGTGEVISVLENTRINITFDENGDLAGLAGCNSYWGTYAAVGDKVSIASLGSTERSCAEPAGIMQQEVAYLKALQDAATFKVRGDTLELRSNDGSLLALYEAWKVPPGG